MRLPTVHGREGATVGVLAVLLSCCDGGRDKLLAQLQSPQPEERAQALGRLAEQNRSEDLILFTQAAKDPSAIVREQAIAGLGRSQDPRVVDLLGELLGDPDEGVQVRAALALAEFKGEKSRGYLTLQYTRRGRSTRHAIVRALRAANVPGPMAQAVASEARTLWERNLKALTEGSPPERVAAAEELGKSGRAEAVNRLLPLLEESQVIIAAAAVRGLGHAGDRRAVGTITALLSENFPDLRQAACEALLRLKDPSALPELAAVAVERSSASPAAVAAIVALPSGIETNRAVCEVALNGAFPEALAAGREMRKRGGCPIEPLLERLQKPSAAAGALQAVLGLGPSAKEALPKVLPLLSSPDPLLRRLAVDALVELGDGSAGDPLLKLFEQELKRVEQLRADWISTGLPAEHAPGFDPAAGQEGKAAAQKLRQRELIQKVDSLQEAQAGKAGKVLLRSRAPAELVDDASEEQLRLLGSLVRALGLLRVPGALVRIEPYANDPSPSLRAAACAGANALGPEGIALARSGLLDADRTVQSAAALGLSEEGGADGQAAILEVLPRLAGDKMRLLEALSRSGAPENAAEALTQILSEGGASTTAAAALLLGELKAKGAVGAMVKCLEDPSGVARREVLIALGKIGDARALEPLGRDLYHDSPDVRAAAAEALAHFARSAAPEAVTPLRAGPMADALEGLKGDYYRKVREAAEAALAKLGSGETAK